jgi:recombination protein RecA
MGKNEWYSRIQRELGTKGTSGDANAVLMMGDKMPDPRRVIYAPTSQSLRWAMDGGLPAGKVAMFAGPESAGKSLAGFDLIKSMQIQDPEGFAILYDAEFSFDPVYAKKLGVDTTRLIVKQTNSGKEIFDHFHTSVMPMVQDGLPLRMMVIDSIKSIRGPKEEALESVEDHMMADLAQLLTKATKLIVGDIRQFGIATVLIQQVNEEMDPNIAKYQSKWRIPNGQALKHFTDILVIVERLTGKDSKIFDNCEVQRGHTVRATVRKNRVGDPYRTADYQIQYGLGTVNIHKEVAGLAVKLGVIEKPNQQTYKFGDSTWRGRETLENAIAEDSSLQAAIMSKIMLVYAEPGAEQVVTEMFDDLIAAAIRAAQDLDSWPPLLGP